MGGINSGEKEELFIQKRIEGAIEISDSRSFGLYIDPEKGIIEIGLPIDNNPNLMVIQNVKELLDNEEQERIVENMEDIGYYLVGITDIDGNIPQEIIEAFKSEDIIRSEGIFKQMDDDNERQKMIFMKIPGMKKVKKIQQKIKHTVAKTFTIPEENDGIIEGLLSISNEVEGLYINMENGTVDRVMKYSKINRAEFVNLEEHLESMEEVELAEKIKERGYFFVGATEIGGKIPQDILKIINPKKGNIILHERIPASEDEKMIFAIIPDLANGKIAPLSQEEIFYNEGWLKGFEIWQEENVIANDEIELDSRNCGLYINTEEGIVEIYSKNGKNTDYPIRDIKDEIFEDEDFDYISKMESFGYYLVGISDELGVLPQYTIDAFDVKDEDITKFHFQKMTGIDNGFMIFKHLPEMPKIDCEIIEGEEDGIFRNIINERMRKLNIGLQSIDTRKIDINNGIFNGDSNAEGIYFNPETYGFELMYIKPGTKSLTISSTIGLINRNIRELEIILKNKRNGYYFLGYTTEDGGIPNYLKGKFNFDRYNTVLHPTIPDKGLIQMIFVRGTGMNGIGKNPSKELDGLENDIPSETKSAVKFFKGKHGLFINELEGKIEMYLKSGNVNGSSIIDVKTLLNGELEELIVRDREIEGFSFMGISNEKGEFPLMIHEVVNIYKNGYTSIPRIGDPSGRRLIFVKVPNMPKPKETPEEFLMALEEKY